MLSLLKEGEKREEANSGVFDKKLGEQWNQLLNSLGYLRNKAPEEQYCGRWPLRISTKNTTKVLYFLVLEVEFIFLHSEASDSHLMQSTPIISKLKAAIPCLPCVSVNNKFS